MKTPSQTSSSSSASMVNAPFARPSTQQIWERIYKRMLQLHPELATSTYAFKTSLQDIQLVGHFDLLSEQKEIEHIATVSSRKDEFVIFSQDNYNLKRHFQMLRRDHPSITLCTAKHSEEDLRPAVESQNAEECRIVTHNPSCSLLSVRLPPIDERAASLLLEGRHCGNFVSKLTIIMSI